MDDIDTIILLQNLSSKSKHLSINLVIIINNDKPLNLIFTLLISKGLHILDLFWTFNSLVCFTGFWLIQLSKEISLCVRTGSRCTSSGYWPRFIPIICAGFFYIACRVWKYESLENLKNEIALKQGKMFRRLKARQHNRNVIEPTKTK